MGYAYGYGYSYTYKTEKRGGSSNGGGALLIGEPAGFATDFTYPNDAQRVAVKAANTITNYALDNFYTNNGTSPKLVYDVAGNLVWSPHNMVLQSENFTASWTTVGNISAVTAHTVQETDAGGSPYIASAAIPTITGATYTVTWWFLKDAVTSRFPAVMALSGGNTFTVQINTSSGAIADLGGVLVATSSVISAGIYWQLSITYVAATTSGTVRIYPSHGIVFGVGSNAAVGTVTVDKVQMNRGSVPTAYLPTTTAARMGLALDYDPVTHALKGLLCEASATNILLNSATLSTQSVTVSAAAYLLSFWGTGTVTLSGVSTAGPLVGTGVNNRVLLSFTPTAGTLTLTVTGTVSNAQLEGTSAGGVPSSYIPTFAATVTRVADSYNFASSTISPSVTAGSWWADVTNTALLNGQMLVRYTSTGAPIGGPSGTAIAIVDSTSLQKTWTQVGAHKIASAYQNADRAITYDGLAASTDAGVTGLILAPGASIFIGFTSYVYIRKICYVPRRKTNVELQIETSGPGGDTLLAGESAGFGADFTWATDTERVAVRTAGVSVAQGVDTFFANSGTSPKHVYDATGTLVWSPHNMFLRSEDFTNASWTKTGTPIVTAHTIEDDDPASQERADQAITSVVVGQRYTISIWLLKDAVTTRFPMFHLVGTGAYQLSVNTSTGATSVPSNSYASASHLVEDLGSYWKIKITFVAENATTTLRIYPAFGITLGTSSITAVGVITIDRVQWNRGSVPTAYLPTTSAARSGLAVDYDPVTFTGKGLLCEPAATNSLLWSTNMTNPAGWFNTGSVTPNAAIAPNGKLEAVKFADDGSGFIMMVGDFPGTVTGTLSFYAKAGELSQVGVGYAVGETFTDGFDLITGTPFTVKSGGVPYTPSGGAKMQYVGNGWYRCSSPCTAIGDLDIFPCVLGDDTWTDPSVIGKGIYLWGPQVETTNTVATSYIPTYAASATRAIDNYTTLTSAFPWNAAGPNSLVVAAAPSMVSPGYYLTMHDGTDTERYVMDTNGGLKKGRGLVIDGNVIQADLGAAGTPVAGTTYKTAMAMATNDIAQCTDAGVVQTDITATLPTVTTLAVGGARAGAAAVYVKNIMVLPRRMTNAELQGKTT